MIRLQSLTHLSAEAPDTMEQRDNHSHCNLPKFQIRRIYEHNKRLFQVAKLGAICYKATVTGTVMTLINMFLPHGVYILVGGGHTISKKMSAGNKNYEMLNTIYPHAKE